MPRTIALCREITLCLIIRRTELPLSPVVSGQLIGRWQRTVWIKYWRENPNCSGYHDNIKVLLCQGYDLAPDVAEHLSRAYGTRANEVLEYVDPARVTESRTGMYKHYRRIFDGAAM